MKNKIVMSLKFIIPFLFWAFLFYPVVFGKTPIVGDTFGHYALVKFFADNLSSGVFPLWNPFSFFGSPLLIDLLSFGCFNPAWLTILFFYRLGVGAYASFMAAYVGYFFLGQIGFYLLAKAILKDKQMAYVAFLTLLFSFFGMYIFTNPTSVFVSVPMMWFFYFLVRFWQKGEKKFFVGTVFATMIILNCYLPLYWLTTFILVILFYGLFQGRRLHNDFRFVLSFVRCHRGLVVLCFLALGLTLIVSWKGYQTVKKGDILALDRRASLKDAYKAGADVAYGKAANLCLTAQTTVKKLFFDLDKISACFGVRYFSLFVYCILFLGFFNRIRKKEFFLFLLALTLFLVALGNQTPVYRFFYNHFFYFKLIHALGTFYFIIGPMVVLLAALQLKSILEDKFEVHRFVRLGIVVVVHAVIWSFLQRQPMLWSTQATILLSALFFSLVALERKMPPFLGALLLVLCILVQPTEVLWRFHDDLENMDFSKERIADDCRYPFASPHFSFTRPDFQEDYTIYDARQPFIYMKDAAGFPLAGAGYPPKGSYYFLQHFGQAARQYVKHKFYLYDRVAVIQDEEEPLGALAEILAKDENLALVSLEETSQKHPWPESLEQANTKISRQVFVVTKPSQHFEVLSFNPNVIKIKTSFPKEKFLVYTDSFHPDWTATINGQKASIYRANVAFKGLKIPAGENIIVLSYAPLGGQLFYMIVLGVHICMLGYLILLFVRRKRAGEKTLC